MSFTRRRFSSSPRSMCGKSSCQTEALELRAGGRRGKKFNTHFAAYGFECDRHSCPSGIRRLAACRRSSSSLAPCWHRPPPRWSYRRQELLERDQMRVSNYVIKFVENLCCDVKRAENMSLINGREHITRPRKRSPKRRIVEDMEIPLWTHRGSGRLSTSFPCHERKMSPRRNAREHLINHHLRHRK